MDSVLSYLFLPLFPKPMGPTTDTTQCCVYCYPRLVNENPTSSTSSQFCFTSPTSSSLLLQTERVTVFCLSPLASCLPPRHMPTSKQVFSLMLFAPSLCLPCSVSIHFFVYCFCQFLRDCLCFYTKTIALLVSWRIISNHIPTTTSQ